MAISAERSTDTTGTDSNTNSVANPRRTRVDADGRPTRSPAALPSRD